MTLFDFEIDNKQHSLLKLDNHNFTVREYTIQDGELIKDVEANNDTLISYVSHWERLAEENSFKKVA